MSDDRPEDPELEELRHRLVREIVERRAAHPRQSSSAEDPTPVDVTGDAVVGFLSAHPRVALDIWAPWCAPCRAMAPVLERLAREWYPEVRFAKLNADRAPQWASRWGVSGIPTLLFFDQRRLVDRVVGAHPVPTLEARIKSVFALPPKHPTAQEVARE